MSRPGSFPRSRRAFTLVEVLLAIGLATALLLVALTFYRQAADLRSQILLASQNLASARLTLDLLANDLRSALPNPPIPFIGGPSSIEFARLAPPQPFTARSTPSSPLRKVALSPQFDTGSTNLAIQALILTETPLRPAPGATSRPSTGFSSNFSTNPPTSVLITNSPVTLPIRFLNLRYWNGFAWQESWFASGPPRGIEITLGLDPLPEDLTPDKYPFEAFRRVVLIPAGRDPDPETLSPDSADPFPPLPL